jgi:hypothetical protein
VVWFAVSLNGVRVTVYDFIIINTDPNPYPTLTLTLMMIIMFIIP